MHHFRHGFVSFAQAAGHAFVGGIHMVDGLADIQVAIAAGPVRTAQAGIGKAGPGAEDNHYGNHENGQQ